MEKYSEKNHATPSVIFRKNNSDWYIAVPLYEWARLFKKSKEKPTVENPNKELQWALVSLKNAIKKVQNYVE